MHSSLASTSAEISDAELVQASRAGDRQAFGRIVRRYQSLVCSTAYSATGSLERSEDVAQETFVTAWQQLPALRDPASLRGWLRGIARNLANNALRRSGREPVQLADSAELSPELAASEPQPCDQAISNEEAALLWRSLAAMPETYREPLVLFYREHQSVEVVARALGLSEDAVKQRLSRGRLMLQAQVLALIEGTLERTKPGEAFTLHVMAALPLAAAMGGAGLVASSGVAAKGTATSTKTIAAIVISGTMITAGLVFFFALIAGFLLLGAAVGHLMSRAAARSAEQREHVRRFWNTMAIAFPACVLPALGAALLGAPAEITTALMWGAGLIHVILLGALAIWDRRSRRAPAEPPAVDSPGAKRRFVRSLGLGMAAPAVFTVMLFAQIVTHPTLTSVRVNAAEGRRMIAERSDAEFTVRLQDGRPYCVEIRLPETHRMVYWAPWDAGTRTVLEQHGRKYQEREHFKEKPIVYRWAISIVPLFLAAAGLVIVWRWPWK